MPTVRPEFRRLFPHAPKEICIAAISATPQKAGGPVEMRVGGGRTTPVTIVVAPGTLLRFQNTDAFKHRLYGVNIKTFPPADTARGGKREWTVPEPGVFEIRADGSGAPSFLVVGVDKLPEGKPEEIITQTVTAIQAEDPGPTVSTLERKLSVAAELYRADLAPVPSVVAGAMTRQIPGTSERSTLVPGGRPVAANQSSLTRSSATTARTSDASTGVVPS